MAAKKVTKAGKQKFDPIGASLIRTSKGEWIQAGDGNQFIHRVRRCFVHGASWFVHPIPGAGRAATAIEAAFENIKVCWSNMGVWRIDLPGLRLNKRAPSSGLFANA